MKKFVFRFFSKEKIKCANLLFLVISGCSTLTGEKLSQGEGPQDLRGIPYSIPRTEFYLTKTSPASPQDKVIYSLNKKTEIDPKQTFTLNMEPGLFVDPDFSISLTSKGFLSGTTATFSDQISPIISSIGSFAKDLAGAMATGALAKDTLNGQLAEYLTSVKSVGACANASTALNLEMFVNKARVSVVDELISRMSDVDNIRFKDQTEFLNSFLYLTEDERACLVAALTVIDDKWKTTAPNLPAGKSFKDVFDEFNEAIKTYINNYPEDFGFANSYRDAVVNQDKKTLKAIDEVFDVDKKSNTELSKSRIKNLNDLNLRLYANEASRINIQLKTLKEIIEIPAANWKAKYVLYLEREMQRAKLKQLRMSATGNNINKFISLARDKLAYAIDAEDLFARAEMLTKFLSTIKNKGTKLDSGPATAEFTVARLELENTLTQIDTKRARVFSEAKPTSPTPKTLNDIPVDVVTNEYIKESLKLGWINTPEGNRAKDFVIVLEELK